MAIEPEWHLNSVVKHVKFSGGTSSVTSAGDAFTVCSLQFAVCVSKSNYENVRYSDSKSESDSDSDSESESKCIQKSTG